jgi:hypothetical protein
MTYEFVTESMVRDQELYRANEILKVAERDGKDASATLREYGVSNSIVNELGIEAKPYVPKGRKNTTQDKLEQWAKENIGKTIKGGQQIADALEISYATANKFVQNRRDIFAKVKKGEYLVKDPVAERNA